MKTLFVIHKNRLFTSDWHLFHKNIWKYEDRFTFIWKSSENLTYDDKISQLSSDDRDREVLQNDFLFFTKVFEELKFVLSKNTQITEFYYLWDFIFGAKSSKIEKIKSFNKPLYDLMHEIFQYLKEKKISRTLIFGNHDDFKKKDEKVQEFYKHFFDNIENYLFFKDEKILISHVPVNRFNLPTKNRYSNFLLWDILQELKSIDFLINYHWHTHSTSPIDMITWDKNIKYINTSIDAYLK